MASSVLSIPPNRVARRVATAYREVTRRRNTPLDAVLHLIHPLPCSGTRSHCFLRLQLHVLPRCKVKKWLCTEVSCWVVERGLGDSPNCLQTPATNVKTIRIRSCLLTMCRASGLSDAGWIDERTEIMLRRLASWMDETCVPALVHKRAAPRCSKINRNHTSLPTPIESIELNKPPDSF